MRTFHIGGTASKVVEQTVVEGKHAGFLKFMSFDAKKNTDHHNPGIAVKNKEGEWVVMNRNAKIAIYDENGREREKYPVVYGARIKIKDGGRVEIGQRLVEWDPYSLSILTDVGGKVAYGDITEGVTMKEEFDEVTGLSRKVVIEHSGTTMRPRVSIKDDSGKTAKVSSAAAVARYLLPVGAHILVEKGGTVHPGDVLAKIPRETTKTKDITGGLPRVAELFEARKPKEQAVISELDGEVSYEGFVKGMRRVIVDNKVGDRKEYSIPKGKHVNVHEGDWVRAGEPLMDGSANPHDILDVLGPKELQKYLFDEVQDVYRLQGVSINDKHIEIIVRQMLRKVRIEDPGDTEFLPGSQVSRFAFEDENERVLNNDGKAALGKPVLLGITKAALTTDSFISAASFQETTRVLTEASINGKEDPLLGLKENVIVGRLIPAGTGFDEYRDTFVISPKQEAEHRELTAAPVGIGQETQQKVETGSTGA
jgi:DNA-directed RNA polymerase subunit beta'